MWELIAIFVLSSILFGLLFWCLLALYDDYCYRRKRRKQFERFMQKRFLMQADSLEAYQAMLRAALWKKDSGKKNGKKNQDI